MRRSDFSGAKIAVLLGLALASTLAGGASAAARFTFLPAENGVFRLDTETGAVTLCVERDAALVCMRAPQEAARPQPPAPERGGRAIARVKHLAEMMMERVTTLVRGLKGEKTEAASLD